MTSPFDGLEPGTVTDAVALTLPLEPLPAELVVAGAPASSS